MKMVGIAVFCLALGFLIGWNLQSSPPDVDASVLLIQAHLRESIAALSNGDTSEGYRWVGKAYIECNSLRSKLAQETSADIPLTP